MTGNQLKIIALITMTIDHIGYVLLPQFGILRVIGRVAFPIFAYMTAEGCFYTHSKVRYLGGLIALGALCQVVCFVVADSLVQSICTTLALSVLTTFALQYLGQHRNLRGCAALAGAVVLDVVACLVLPELLTGTGFRVDYGLFGVLLGPLVYLPRVLFPHMGSTRLRLVTLVPFACGLAILSYDVAGGFFGVQWWCLMDVALMAFYNGRRGTWRMKYLFYVYYPLHLAVIWGIALVL